MQSPIWKKAVLNLLSSTSGKNLISAHLHNHSDLSTLRLAQSEEQKTFAANKAMKITFSQFESRVTAEKLRQRVCLAVHRLQIHAHKKYSHSTTCATRFQRNLRNGQNPDFVFSVVDCRSTTRLWSCRAILFCCVRIHSRLASRSFFLILLQHFLQPETVHCL